MSLPTQPWGGERRFYNKNKIFWSPPKSLSTTTAATTIFKDVSTLSNAICVPACFKIYLRPLRKKEHRWVDEMYMGVQWLTRETLQSVQAIQLNWAIEALEKKWLPEYIDFCTIVSKLKYRDPKFAYIAHLPTEYSLYLRPIPRATTTASSSKTTADLLIAQHKAEKTSHNKFYNQTNNKYFLPKSQQQQQQQQQ